MAEERLGCLSLFLAQEFSASTNADALLACQDVAVTMPWLQAQAAGETGGPKSGGWAVES